MPRQVIGQPRIQGQKRIPAYTGLLNAIEEKIEEDMVRYGVTRSFVIATALAHVYGIDEQPDFKTISRKRRSRRR